MTMCGEKQEHERSEWLEGLIYAERTLRYKGSEVFVEHSNGMNSYNVLYRNHTNEKPWIIKSDVSLEFGQGVIDYNKHKREIERR